MTDASRGGDGQTDLELIARWQRGDERAATALVERHAQALARFACSFGASEEADDLVQEAANRVQDAMKRLSPTQREVFTLRVGQGLSYKEIAEIVGTTEGAARVHYHNAMRAVKEHIDD
jgi:RNA polymerase sigma-70 factor (ECF subfamily)